MNLDNYIREARDELKEEFGIKQCTCKQDGSLDKCEKVVSKKLEQFLTSKIKEAYYKGMTKMFLDPLSKECQMIINHSDPK